MSLAELRVASVVIWGLHPYSDGFLKADSVSEQDMGRMISHCHGFHKGGRLEQVPLVYRVQCIGATVCPCSLVRRRIWFYDSRT